ncbi:hypothetical protein Ancab_019260 [Ancistrocladus abbreviatus]
MAEDADIGFEEGLSWLPSHVLDEACGDYVKERSGGERGRHYHQRVRLTGEPLPQTTRSSTKGHHRARHPNHRASGGPGMRAIFLDSGHRSCGTGVFLPRTAGACNSNSGSKPACSPVLLPSRVIQALNLNVHALGLQVTSPRDTKGNKISGCSNFGGNKESKDVTTQCRAISPNSSPSRDIFLPNEWSY